MSSPDIPDTGHSSPPTAEEATTVDPRRGTLAGTAGRGALALANLERPKTGEERVAALVKLRDEMIACSADPSGTPISGEDGKSYAPYVAPDILAAIDEFKEIPEDKRWSGAVPITHDDSTFRWFGKKRKFDTPVEDPDGKPVVGRRVGYITVNQFETPVLYCSDDKLRMLIKTTGTKRPRNAKFNGKKIRDENDYKGPYAGRTFTGYCRLPDPTVAMPARSRGFLYLVNYIHQQSKTLRGELGLK